MSPAQAQCNLWFDRLKPLLVDRLLPCEHGPARVVGLDEFMFMQEVLGTAQFKHRDTRNYIMVRPAVKTGEFDVPSPNGFELVVPFTTAAFKKGFFDRF